MVAFHFRLRKVVLKSTEAGEGTASTEKILVTNLAVSASENIHAVQIAIVRYRTQVPLPPGQYVWKTSDRPPPITNKGQS